MTDLLKPFLEQQGFVVLDGALATELEQLGADLNDPLWSARCLLESPGLVSRVHRDYLRAGADVISSATYQASEAGFRDRGMTRSGAGELLKRGVGLAIEARDAFWESESATETGHTRLKPLVAASMGPFGACLHDGSEYHGNYAASWKEVADFHRERTLRLAEAGADLLAFETIPSRAEAEVLLELLEHHADDLQGQKAWISFSCKDGNSVSHGESFPGCMELLSQSSQVIAGGINCTAPEWVLPLLKQCSEFAFPLMVYPNSGETWVAHEHSWVGEGTCSFPVEHWFSAGARLIGGCCRTRPGDIYEIRNTLKDLNKEA